MWSATNPNSGIGATEASADTTGACPAAPVWKAFAPWGDPADYKLVPGGDFEGGGAGWALTGGASVVAGSSPYAPTGKTGAASLSLPEGASATSPAVCIQPGSPVARFFAVTDGAGSGASLRVEVLDAAGEARPAGSIPALSTWDATRRFATAQGKYLSGGTVAMVRVRLTADPGASWRVDDVFVDPRSRG